MITYRLGPGVREVVEPAPFIERYPLAGRFLARCLCHDWKMHESQGTEGRCGRCRTGVKFLRRGW